MSDEDIGAGIGTQGRLTVGQSVTSNLTLFPDADWFQITLEAGKAYTFTLSRSYWGVPLLNMSQVTLRLHDSTGLTIDYVGGNFSDIGAPITMSFVAGQSGSYYVDVNGYYGNATGDYTLQAAPLPQAPDDYAPDASTTGVMTSGQAVHGKFETAGDVDWFKFHADAGQSYSFSFAKGAGLVDADNYIIYGANGAAQDIFSSYPFQALATGDYYIGLYSGPAGDYSVTMNHLPDDYSANNISPGQLAVGGSISGAIQYRNDTDRFHITLEQGKVYTFDLSADDPLFSHLNLGCTDDSGNQITLSKISSANDVLRLSFAAPKSGVYSLDVIPDSLWAATTEAHYTLSSLPDMSDDVGNTVAKATTLAVGSSFSGKIDVPGDIDMFRLDVTAGVSYKLSLDSVTAVNGQANPQFSLSAVNASGQPQGTPLHQAGSYIFTPSTSGPYYFQTSADALENYTLSVQPAADDFAGNAAGAGQLSLTTPARGMIEFNGDRDWFGIPLDAGATYWFSLHTPSGDGVDNTTPRLDKGRIQVMDASGTVVATAPIASLDFPPALSFTPTSKGTYYLEVQGVDGYSNGVGIYQLQAQLGVRDDVGNDNAHAAVLTPGVTKSGTLEVWGDQDVFKLSVTAGVTYGLVLQVSGAPTNMTVTDSSGHTIVPANTYGPIQFQASASDDYYVTIAGAYSFTGSGSYQLTAISHGDDDYAGNTATTGVLAANGSAHGNFSYTGDSDWFKVHVEAGQSYVFNLIGASGGGGTLDTGSNGTGLTLYDSNGTYMRTSGSNGSSGDIQLSYAANTTGDLYIAALGNTGSYTLTETAASTDVTPPALLAVTPADGVGGVALSGTISLSFNENIMLGTYANISLVDANGKGVALSGGGTGTVAGQTLVIDPLTNLQPGMTYTLYIASGTVLDLAGNKAVMPNQFTFSTVAAVTAGTDGNDFLVGSGTGLQLNGGNGIDTVYYDNRNTSMNLYRSGDKFIVARAGSAQGDTLTGIERVVFADHAVALDIDGHGGQVYRLYQAAFDRTPDQAGLGFWMAAMDSGQSLQSVAHGFVASAEFQSLYGSSTTDAQYVNLLYQNVLHRGGDAGGTAFWLDILQRGYSRDEVLTAFSESPENQAALIGAIGNGFTYIPHA